MILVAYLYSTALLAIFAFMAAQSTNDPQIASLFVFVSVLVNIIVFAKALAHRPKSPQEQTND